MFYVYVIKDSLDKTYVGYSSDLKRRIAEQLNKKVSATTHMVEPKLYYYEAYQTEDMARLREKKLKQYGSSYKGLFKRIQLRP